MKIRPAGGLLERTMAQVAEIEPTAQAVCDWLNRDPMVTSGIMRPSVPADLAIQPAGIDERTGWDTRMVVVTADGHTMPLAWIDGPLSASE